MAVCPCHHRWADRAGRPAGRTRTLTLFAAVVVVLAVLVLEPVSAGPLAEEFSKEQLFLLQRRGQPMLPSSTAPTLTRALPSPQRRELLASAVQSMPSRELRRVLRDKDTDCFGCTERNELVERVLEVSDLPTSAQRVASELTTMENTPPTEETVEHNTVVAVEAAMGLQCTILDNRTIMCTQPVQA